MLSLKRFMDDTTVFTSHEVEARKMFQRLKELINWCKMAFKPKKSRSLTLKKGKLDNTVNFEVVSGQIIHTVSQEPV